MYEDLQESYNRLNHFNQMVSHNLRSPIANIISITELLNEEDLESEEHLQLMEGIKNMVVKLDLVINDMTKILTIEKNVNELKQEIDLMEIVNDIIVSENWKILFILI